MFSRIIRNVAEIIEIYLDKRVPRAASSLSYSLILSLFPFLMCLNAMLGSLHITQTRILEVCTGIIPAGAIDIISAYFNYVSQYDTTTIFVTGLAVTLTSSSAAFRSLLVTMADIHGSQKKMGFVGLILSFILSVAFLIVIYLSCLVIIGGMWLTKIVEQYITLKAFSTIWNWLRFPSLFILLYIIIYAVYWISSPREKPRIPRAGGALFASVVLVGVGIVFSRVISYSTRYTFVYGSLASIIVLLIWIYTSGCVVILGNIINIVIFRNKPKKEIQSDRQIQETKEDKANAL